MRAAVALGAVILVCGCGSAALSREQYLAQSNTIAQDFKRYQLEVRAIPLPSVAGLTKAAARKLLADDLRAQADHDDQFGKRMAALIPPPEFADHKAAYMNLLGGLGPKLRVWADKIETDNRRERDVASRNLDTFLLSSLDTLIAVTEKHGEDAASLKLQRAGLAADLSGK
jgi:hypothetical protein